MASCLLYSPAKLGSHRRAFRFPRRQTINYNPSWVWNDGKQIERLGLGGDSVVSDPSVDQTGQGLYSLKSYDVYVFISLVKSAPDLYFYIAYTVEICVGKLRLLPTLLFPDLNFINLQLHKAPFTTAHFTFTITQKSINCTLKNALIIIIK